MSKLVLVSLLAIGLSVPARGQTDPLSPTLMPAIDTNPADYPGNIWVTGPLAKVLQNTGTPGNVKWAIVYATQNEIQSFQVHVQSPSAGIANLSVTMSDLVNAKTGTHISAASTDIVVYIERYMNVTIKTSTSPTYLNTTGFIPDILVPAVDPYYHQTTNAFPFTVAPNQNQSVWVDVHVPTTAPSGFYSGTVTVKSGSTALATLPVVYAVWQWPKAGFMPSTSSLPMVGSGFEYNGFCYNAYGGASGCGAYPGAGGSSDTANQYIRIDGAIQMLDNRYTIDEVANVFPGTGSFATYNALYGPLLNGTASHVPSILRGAQLTTVDMICAGSCNGKTAAEWQNWATNFQAQGWLNKLFWYLCDEPAPGGGGPAIATCAAEGTANHLLSNPIIPQLITTSLTVATNGGALNSIDWMIPDIGTFDPQGGTLTRSSYDTWLAGTIPSGPKRKLGTYQACGSAGTCANGYVGPSNATWPNLHIDGQPVANRVMEWLSFYHNVSFELYYAVDICDGNSGQAANCGYPTHPFDPFTSVYYSGGWGDGTLMYACSAARCGVTTPIWLPSMRLKMIRDGMQDYEYLNVLTNAGGQGTFIQQQISSWITNSYTFNTNPTGLTAARQALGTKLHQLTYSTSLLPPGKLGGTAQ